MSRTFHHRKVQHNKPFTQHNELQYTARAGLAARGDKRLLMIFNLPPANGTAMPIG